MADLNPIIQSNNNNSLNGNDVLLDQNSTNGDANLDYSGVASYYGGVEGLWSPPPRPQTNVNSSGVPLDYDLPPERKGSVPSIFNRYSIFFFNNTQDVSKSPVKENYMDSIDRISDENLMKVRLKPTAENIINWSRSGNTNAVEYAYEDFLWCKNYGQVPNNYLITLRRFPTPVEDVIFDNKKVPNPDIGRLISWVDGETNKWDKVGLSWNHGFEWKPLKADIQPIDTSNAGYGTTEVGGIGKVVGLLRSDFSKGMLSNPNMTGSEVGYNNTNAIYGPIDVINETNVRDRGLKFEQKIELTFEYKLKSIDGINPKVAFIDLLSNILIVTSNRGPFWGGDVRYYGSNPRRFKPIGDPKSLEGGDWGGYLKSMMSGISGLFSSMAAGKSVFSFEGLGNLFKNLGGNLGNQLAGAQLDKMGRPGIMAINSLLTGESTGNWHLMIGNPSNPIISIGNLMLKNTKIEFGGVLGIDDFPTELKVVCELEPARPRDRIDIISMFHRNNRTYLTTSPISNVYAANVQGRKNGGKMSAGEKKLGSSSYDSWKQEFLKFSESGDESKLDFNKYVDERFPNHRGEKGLGYVHSGSKLIG